MEPDEELRSAPPATLDVDVCRAIDLEKGLAAYPDEDTLLRESLCPPPGDYHDFRVFRGYVDRDANRNVPAVRDAACPVCGSVLVPDEIWQKKGSNTCYTLCRCPVCAGTQGPAGKGVFLRYKASRRDGLHWAFARCTELPDAAGLARWEKQRAQTIERMKKRAAQQAAAETAPDGC